MVFHNYLVLTNKLLSNFNVFLSLLSIINFLLTTGLKVEWKKKKLPAWSKEHTNLLNRDQLYTNLVVTLYTTAFKGSSAPNQCSLPCYLGVEVDQASDLDQNFCQTSHLSFLSSWYFENVCVLHSCWYKHYLFYFDFHRGPLFPKVRTAHGQPTLLEHSTNSTLNRQLAYDLDSGRKWNSTTYKLLFHLPAQCSNRDLASSDISCGYFGDQPARFITTQTTCNRSLYPQPD